LVIGRPLAQGSALAKNRKESGAQTSGRGNRDRSRKSVPNMKPYGPRAINATARTGDPDRFSPVLEVGCGNGTFLAGPEPSPM
jgi:hypothetical protein